MIRGSMRGAPSVIEAISIIGPRNVSALARHTSLPIETVRYLLRSRFPRIGLRPQLYVDFKRLGLMSIFADLTFTAELTEQAPRILKALAVHGCLTSYDEFADRHGYSAIFAPAVSVRPQLEDVLQEMVSRGFLASVQHQQLTWSRRVSVDPTYFDLRRGHWRVDWTQLPERPYVEPMLSMEPQTESQLDQMDLVILKELQKDAMLPVSKIAGNLGLSRRVAQYHYQHHLPALAVNYYVRWVGTRDERHQIIVLQLRFRHVTGRRLRQVRVALGRLPFLVWEGGNDGGLYVAWANLPQGEFLASLAFLKTQLGDIANEMDLRIIRMDRSVAYTLPYEQFDAKAGWQFKSEAVMAALEPLVPAIAKKR